MFLHESLVPSSGEHFEVDVSVIYIIAAGLTLLLGSRKYIHVCIPLYTHTHIYLYLLDQLLSHVQLFAVSWTVVCQAPLSMEFSRQQYWSGVTFPSPGDLPNPGIALASPALEADSLPLTPPGKPLYLLIYIFLFIYTSIKLSIPIYLY